MDGGKMHIHNQVHSSGTRDHSQTRIGGDANEKSSQIVLGPSLQTLKKIQHLLFCHENNGLTS